jgi:hypothetical protein
MIETFGDNLIVFFIGLTSGMLIMASILRNSRF